MQEIKAELTSVTKIPDIKIKIDDEYAELVPRLSDQDYRTLKKSIEENGLWYPITVNERGIILDGHHRFRICNELKTIPKVEIKKFNDPLNEKLFVINSNLQRRQLTTFQRIELALRKKPIYQEIARRNTTANLANRDKKPSVKYLALGRVDEKIAVDAHTSRGTVNKVEFLLEKGSMEATNSLREGRSTISKEYFRVQKAIRVKDAQQKAAMNFSKSPNKNSLFDLMLGDMRKLADDIAENSIDMIFTDPPYEKEYLPLYGELAKLAHRVLKPGGSLVFFMGHFHEDEIESYIIKNNSSSLVFNHRFIVRHTGHIRSLTSQRIWAYYKPLMHYYKLKVNGKRPTPFHDIADVTKSEAVPKDDHAWEQSTVEAEHMIEPLTVEKQTVLDPFMGSGTTGLAALQLKRRFIGIEIREDHFITAKAKLSKLSSSGK